MRIVILSLFAFSMMLLYPGTTHAQTEIWHSSDSSGHSTTAQKVAVDAAGNIYAAGEKEPSFDSTTIVKFDTAGVAQWSRTLPGNSVVMTDMVVDEVGNIYYCVVANAQSFISKVNNTGTVQWLYVNDTVQFDGLNIDKDGNILAGAGASNSQVAIFKLSPIGTVIWIQYFGTAPYYYFGNQVTSDAAGNIYVNATRNLNNGGNVDRDFLALKCNSAGIVQWAQAANSAATNQDNPSSMSVDHAGNVYLVGNSDTVQASLPFLVKYGNDGNIRWSSNLMGTVGNKNIAGCALDNNGNLYVAGGDSDRAYIAEIDTASGNALWVFHYGSSPGVLSAIKFANNALYATGFIQGVGTGNDVVTLKVGTDGQLIWGITYNGFGSGNDRGEDIVAQPNGDVFVGAATVEISNAASTLTVIKYHETLSGIFESPANAPFTVSAYPNPTDRELQFTVDMNTPGHAAMYVYDLAGQQIATVFDRQMDAGKNTAVWNASPLAKGTYLYEMVTPAGKTSGKFVKY